VRASTTMLRSFLVARDAGGGVPVDHPAAHYVNK
jgi:hypothetical protein